MTPRIYTVRLRSQEDGSHVLRTQRGHTGGGGRLWKTHRGHRTVPGRGRWLTLRQAGLAGRGDWFAVDTEGGTKRDTGRGSGGTSENLELRSEMS